MRRRTRCADVEVAGFLSGGVDSAYLTALAHPARTYTISYAEPKYDESFPARALARSLGVRNRVRRISPGEFWDAVPAVQYHMDEPLADAAAVALYFLNREAAKDVKVVLSGEGADELFGGYNIYRDPFTARWWRPPAALAAGRAGGGGGAAAARARVNFLVRRGMSLEERYFGPTALFNEREKRRLLADYAGDGDPMFLTEAIWDATEGLDPVTRMQQVDLNLVAGRGHPAQGRQDEHGAQFGAAGAVSGPGGLGAGRRAARCRQGRRTHDENCPAPGRGTHAARRQRRA